MCLVEELGSRCSCEPIDCDGSYKPICGKDGRSYNNDCWRRKAECLSNSLIPVKHPGPCGEWILETDPRPSCLVVFLSEVSQVGFAACLNFPECCLKGWLVLSKGGRGGGWVFKKKEPSLFIYLLNPVTLHTFISNRQTKRQLHVSLIFTLSLTPLPVLVFHSRGFCRLFLFCLYVFLYKKNDYSFLFQCISLSECLSLSVWPSSLAVWAQVDGGVTQWATSSGGF